MKNKKWQNLLHKKCIYCGADLSLFSDRVILYECNGQGCGFIITRRKYVEILLDESHIMRNFLTQEEFCFLKKVIQTNNF